MRWTEGTPSNLTLIGLTIFSIALFYVAEQTAEPERQPHFDKKLESAQLALVAGQAIKNQAELLGIKLDPQNDPFSTGLIGQENTLITSDRGVVTSKILSTNPNYAAAFVDMLMKAKIKKHSTVAIGMTGSFPGWNISFMAACAALELKPITISSVGASDWGANVPTLTWLDMETLLNQKGILKFRSIAASIGGGVASVGGSQNARLIPPGLTVHLGVKNFPVRAVINQMAEQGIPVINLLEVEKIAQKYNLPTEVGEEAAKLGEGSLFFKDRYSVSSTIMLTLILVIVVFIMIRIDIKHYLFRKKTPIQKVNVV